MRSKSGSELRSSPDNIKGENKQEERLELSSEGERIVKKESEERMEERKKRKKRKKKRKKKG